MDSENNHQEKSTQDEHSPQDEAPLNDSGNEEEIHKISSDDLKGDEINQWVREISDDSDVQNEDFVESLDNVPVNKGDLPDWINELSPADQEINDAENEIQENQRNIQFESTDDLWDAEQLMESENEVEQTSISEDAQIVDEGFVEISEYDLETVDEKMEDTPLSEEPEKEQEKLPDWLEDMIAEHSESSMEIKEEIGEEQDFLNDEPTKPIPIVEETSQEDNLNQTIGQTELTPNQSLDEIELGESETQIEDSIHIVDFKEETIEEKPEDAIDIPPSTDQEFTEISDGEETPVVLEDAQTYEEFQTKEENWELHDQQPLEIPKTLRFAKYLLDQGEINPAYEIFQTYINKADHLEEIESWILDAIDEDKISKSKLWEILGDIATKKNKHAEALSAYSKSISILLNN